MLSVQKHKQIHDLLWEWESLAKLYEAVQTNNNLTVMVNGSHRTEFREGAICEAKKVLNEKAQRLKADLHQLGLDTSTLTPLREVPRPEKTDD